MKKGILYGVGVGPGNPDMMTIQAVKTLKNADIIAVPRTEGGRTVAYDIAGEYIKDKLILELDMPMIHDKELLKKAHDKAADELCALLTEGKSIAFITLGDVSLYSTFSYVQVRVEQRGYDVELIAGIPAMCAIAAKLKKPIATGMQRVHIFPATRDVDGVLEFAEKGDSVVVMKIGKRLGEAKQLWAEHGLTKYAGMVEKCTMPDEKIYITLDEAPDSAQYFSTILINKKTLI